MESYLDVWLNTEGADLKTVMKALAKLGLKPLSGHHDFLIEWDTEKEFLDKMAAVHKVLKGCGAYYRVETLTSRKQPLLPWPPKVVGSPKE